MWQGKVNRETKKVRLWVLTGCIGRRYTVHMLKKTSVQLDSDTLADLLKQYPSLSLSEIIRLSTEYLLANKPTLVVGKTMFVPSKGDSQK